MLRSARRCVRSISSSAKLVSTAGRLHAPVFICSAGLVFNSAPVTLVSSGAAAACVVRVLRPGAASIVRRRLQREPRALIVPRSRAYRTPPPPPPAPASGPHPGRPERGRRSASGTNRPVRVCGNAEFRWSAFGGVQFMAHSVLCISR
ncbi:hypothetical protein NDU88_001330 [Pleurodeles waltl]|uniref:Uncharacterized protein n=1 Tax=Pleurodeles waltl TaxID=8319 RepID=A0AAV7P6B6_PLEWA|nr:hypothetical protein NDU88_001330 [Pleurodeles waltl]